MSLCKHFLHVSLRNNCCLPLFLEMWKTTVFYWILSRRLAKQHERRNSCIVFWNLINIFPSPKNRCTFHSKLCNSQMHHNKKMLHAFSVIWFGEVLGLWKCHFLSHEFYEKCPNVFYNWLYVQCFPKQCPIPLYCNNEKYKCGGDGVLRDFVCVCWRFFGWLVGLAFFVVWLFCGFCFVLLFSIQRTPWRMQWALHIRENAHAHNKDKHKANPWLHTHNAAHFHLNL